LFNLDLQTFIEEVRLPIEQIMPMTNFKILIPLKIKSNAIPCELS